MKEYNDQLMKFKITNDKLKMEIKLSDLAWLFRNSPENENDTRWGHMLEGIFQEIRESAADFLKYYKDCF